MQSSFFRPALTRALTAVTLSSALAAAAFAQPEKPAAEPAKDKPAMVATPRPAVAPRIEMAPKGEFPETMPIPSDAASLGTAYQVISGRSKQINWVSDAPAEKIEGVSNNVVGYIIAGDAAAPAALKAAEWSLPVKSMRTGNPTRDGHMCDAEWLNAAQYPNITFKLKRVEDLKDAPVAPNAKVDPHVKSFVATLVGDITIKGVTKEITVPDTQIRFRSSEALGSSLIGDGELMFFRSKFGVQLADYGVAHDVISVKQKVAEKIEITVNLICSTGGPAKGGDKPEAKPEGKTDGKTVGS